VLLVAVVRYLSRISLLVSINEPPFLPDIIISLRFLVSPKGGMDCGADVFQIVKIRFHTIILKIAPDPYSR